MTSTEQHLVLIRGNSASGKTSLARELQLAMGRGTANIRAGPLPASGLREHDVPGGDNIDLIALAVRRCLKIGYHVVLEGILYSKHYGAMLHAFSTSTLDPGTCSTSTYRSMRRCDGTEPDRSARRSARSRFAPGSSLQIICASLARFS